MNPLNLIRDDKHPEKVSPSKLFSFIGLSIVCAGYARYCWIIDPPINCKDFLSWSMGLAVVTLVFSAVVCGNRLLVKILDSKYAGTIVSAVKRKR